MPLRALLCNLSFLVLLSTPAVSQQVLTGKVRQKTTDAILASVTVVNHTQNKYNVSDAGGNYRIVASPGDISPVSYFSPEQKNLRQLKQRVKSEEKDFYIDSRFPSSYVSLVTGLRGDSLQLFMVTYRPTYKFCRGATNEDILLYINEKLKMFQKTWLEHPMFAIKQN